MKTIVITGANSGVGHTASGFFADAGYKVIGISRSTDQMARIESKNFTCIQADVSNLEEISVAFSKIESVDILINSAAQFQSAEFASQDMRRIEKMIDTNLKGTVFSTRLVLEKMKQGHIINISSVSGCYGIPNQAVYSATKHALKGFAESLNKECVPRGINVTNVCPGGINTPLWNEENPYDGDKGRLLRAMDIVKVIDFIIQSGNRIVFKELVFFPNSETH